MAIVENLISLTERAPLPDSVTRAGVHYLVDRTRRALARSPASTTRDFARTMTDFPVALATGEANQQHYEIPASFFRQVLGHRFNGSTGQALFVVFIGIPTNDHGDLSPDCL